ncbi:hypothetical protein L1987_05745 [Smallanthus sonchifolius]|uniref:Uncharacterized protein n=1 Tax=Smallanthus sonchifolius TaxID=185202 RepID=A0ACB9JW68_9ASTR|nr:hypothetical protein L1987_05745 [Smallanthus sonchifolius]
MERLACLTDDLNENDRNQEQKPEPCLGFLHRENFSENISPEDSQRTVKICVDSLSSSSVAVKRRLIKASAFLTPVSKDRREPPTFTTGIPSKSATTDPDRKRKETSDRTAAADHHTKHNHHHKKKPRMSSSSSDKVRASHILIKHQGSRRKASWKDPDGRIISSTTRDEAVSQLKSLRDDIVSGKSKFEDVASRYSDCSSAKRGGDLGLF